MITQFDYAVAERSGQDRPILVYSSGWLDARYSFVIKIRPVEIDVMLLYKRVLTRLLLLDQPISPRTDAEVDAEVARNYRWNFTVSVMDGITFWFGFAFVSATTIIPLFVSKVTLNPLIIGLIAMLAQAGWHIPQLFSAGAIERIPRKKPIMVNLGFFLERVPVLLWPVSALLCLWSPELGLALFIITYAWHGFGAGIIAPAWQDLLARIIPVAGRGRMYGLTTFLGTGFAAAGAFISGYILERYEYPYDFMLIFLIAAVAILISWGFLALTRESVGAPVEPLSQHQSIWPRMTTILRGDINFRRFLIVRIILTLGTMGLGFITVSAVETLGIADSTVGLYTVTLLAGQTIGGLVAGLIADRAGHKRSLALGALAMCLAFLILLAAPAPATYFAAFALTGFSTGVNIVSGLLVALEFAPANRRPTYVGLSNSAMGIASMAAPMLGGWLAYAGYWLAFSMSALVGLVGLLFLLFWVHDPRYTPVAAPPVPVQGE
jgi:MFS family permease